MEIYVLDAKAGAGKTTAVINSIAKNKDKKYLLVQETKDLISQTTKTLDEMGVGYVAITSDTSKNTTSELIDAVANESRVLITTRATFMNVTMAGFKFSGYHCYFDEFPEVFTLVNLKTEWKTAEIFQSLYEVVNEGLYNEITASKECHELKNTKPSDYALNAMMDAGIIAALTSECHKVFLSPDSKQMGILTTPEIFGGMRSVTLVGAKFDYHEVSLFWKEHEFTESPLQSSLRDVENKANVLIGYFNVNRWSKSLKTEDGQSQIIAGTLNKFFESQDDYLFTENQLMIDEFIRSGLRLWKVDKYKGSSTGAYIVPCKAAGLNDYRECLNAAFMNSMSRDTNYYVAAKAIMGFTAHELFELEVKCHNAYYAYQFCYRTKIREYGFNGEVNFVVGSEMIAKYLSEMIGEGGTVRQSQLTQAMNDVSDHSCFAYTRAGEVKTNQQKELKLELKAKRSCLTKLLDNRNRYNNTAKTRGKELKFCPDEIQLVRDFIKTVDINSTVVDMTNKMTLVDRYIEVFTDNKEYKAIAEVEVNESYVLAQVKPAITKEPPKVQMKSFSPETISRVKSLLSHMNNTIQ